MTLGLSHLSQASTSKELVILTWPDYMSPDIVQKYEDETGNKIKFVYFDGTEERDSLVRKSAAPYDITLISDYDFRSYTRERLLHFIKKKNIPNLSNIPSRWKFAVKFTGSYGVPYFWGTLGIAYRSDLYPEGFNSWLDFFEPAPPLKDKLAYLDDSREVFGMAVKALGYSANTNNSTALDKANEMLLKNKDYVHQYKLVSLSEDSELLKGTVWAAMIYSGDAIGLMEQNDKIQYIIPKEGGNLWIDYFVILKASKNKELAEHFLNYLNIPEIAAENAEYVNYATPNGAALELASKEYLNTNIIFPSKDVMSRSEIFKALNPATLDTISRSFQNLEK